MIRADINGREVELLEVKRGVSTMVNATGRPFHGLEPGHVAHFAPNGGELLTVHTAADRATCEHCRGIGL